MALSAGGDNDFGGIVTDVERLKDTFDRIGVQCLIEHKEVTVDFKIMKGVQTHNQIIMEDEMVTFYFDGEGVFLGHKYGVSPGPASTQGEFDTVPEIMGADGLPGPSETLAPVISGMRGNDTGSHQQQATENLQESGHQAQVTQTNPINNQSPLHALWGKAHDKADYDKRQWVALQHYVERLERAPNNMMHLVSAFVIRQHNALNELLNDLRKELGQ